MIPEERVRLLVAAKRAYDAAVSPAYDEVVTEVAARAVAEGSMGKLDLGALVAWKRLQANAPWMTNLMATPDKEVRVHTALAVTAAREGTVVAAAAAAARSALSPLPGMGRGDAFASAVCFAAAPHRLAVYDRRARRALLQLGLVLDNRPGRYGRYITLIEQCRDDLRGRDQDWSARDVDLALFQLGKS